LARYPTFAHAVDLIRANRDVKLLVEVETGVQLASYSPGRIEFVPTSDAPRDLAQRLGARLQQWTGSRWAVSLVNEGGAPTIAADRDAASNALRSQAQAHPMVQAALAAFPKATITSITTAAEIAQEAAVEALPEVDEEWDPFEDG
jgi:DNA polymerase-3 subunit gamma/tau